MKAVAQLMWNYFSWAFLKTFSKFFDVYFSPSIKLIILIRTMSLQLFFKQLGSDLSPQSCLYFHGSWGSKCFQVLNGFLVVWPSNLCLQRIQQFWGFKINIYDQRFKIFLTMLLKQLDFGVLPVYQAQGLRENGLALKVA